MGHRRVRQRHQAYLRVIHRIWTRSGRVTYADFRDAFKRALEMGFEATGKRSDPCCLEQHQVSWPIQVDKKAVTVEKPGGIFVILQLITHMA
jgi:hypothetical protein